jgi:anti-sigma B factor antagonist
VRHEGAVVIVNLCGRITLGDGWGTLRETVRSLLLQGDRLILLNMKDVSYIDSAGLGELVGSYATVTKQGGQLKLVYTENKVRDVLQVTRLNAVFENFLDEAAALESFAGRASGAA